MPSLSIPIKVGSAKHYPISLEVDNDAVRVVYGCDVSAVRDYDDAARQLGYYVMHAIMCEHANDLQPLAPR